MKIKLGPTGTFPDGKAAPDDAGGLQMAISSDADGKMIRVSFGVPVTWVGFPPADARKMAQLLMKQADICEKMVSRQT